MLELRSMRRLLVTVALSLTVPSVARADAHPDPSQDPEVKRLLDAKGQTLRWSWAPPGRGEKYGHAETLVATSADNVRKTALDFAHYRELHRKFSSARVIAKEGDNTDVYMKLPVKVGPITIDQWEVMRFGPAKQAGDAAVIEGFGVKGNMKTGHIKITVRPVDEKHSLLKVDLLLVPSTPAPSALVDEELRDAAMDFANGLKDKSQGWSGPVSHLD
jgi:hypothetical protein